VLPEDATVMAAYQTKQLDVLVSNIGAQQADEIRKAVPTTAGVEYLRPNPMHLYMNTRKEPLGDLRVRKAIAFGVDFDEFNKVLFNGKGGMAHVTQANVMQSNGVIHVTDSVSLPG